MGMYRGWPEKTNRHNFLSDQDQADGDDVETSQENSEAQPTKKKKRSYNKSPRKKLIQLVTKNRKCEQAMSATEN